MLREQRLAFQVGRALVHLSVSIAHTFTREGLSHPGTRITITMNLRDAIAPKDDGDFLDDALEVGTLPASQDVLHDALPVSGPLAVQDGEREAVGVGARAAARGVAGRSVGLARDRREFVAM